MAVEIGLNSFPPPPSIADGRDISPPITTVSFSPKPSPPVRSVCLRPPAGVSPGRRQVEPFSIHKLKDFKDFTTRDMVDKVGLLLGAIQENQQLKMSLQTVLRGSNLVTDMRALLQYCSKAGGLLGHRPEYTTDAVDLVFSNLDVKSIPQRVKEVQALQLICESLLDFHYDVIGQIIALTSDQRQKLLKQYQSTQLGSDIHSFCDKGSWTDHMLRPILEHSGYKLVYGHLQFHRNSTVGAAAAVSNRDLVRSATMAVLSVEIVMKLHS